MRPPRHEKELASDTQILSVFLVERATGRRKREKFLFFSSSHRYQGGSKSHDMAVARATALPYELPASISREPGTIQTPSFSRRRARCCDVYKQWCDVYACDKEKKVLASCESAAIRRRLPLSPFLAAAYKQIRMRNTL